MGRFLIFILLANFLILEAQVKKDWVALGVVYGFGNEMKSNDYRYTNQFVKLQLDYQWNHWRTFSYGLVFQPEVNFGTHQLLNEYFVKPETPNYQALRDEFTKMKSINQYILNVGLFLKYPITAKFQIYLLGSVGPLYSDTETERLSKGFAFSDVIAFGTSIRVYDFSFDIRPSLRHVSNAGLYTSNSGINTYNFEFLVMFQL